jgi:hypothetical protein
MIIAIGTEHLYVDFRYNVYVDADIDIMTMRGAHGINDGGYHNWMYTIANSKEGTSTTEDEERWSGTIESARKNAERCFGMMKKRSKVLHVKSCLHKARSIETRMKEF